MHPDLLNNSLFLRYYEQWQKDPESIVFAPIADFFLRYGMVDEAFKICLQGLSRHENLTTGHIVMAKIQLSRGNVEEAEDAVAKVLQIMPSNKHALRLLEEVNAFKLGEHSNIERIPLQDLVKKAKSPKKWHTVTMANIYAQQGHVERAKNIFESILEREPDNQEAKKGLAAITS
ncbi:MAG: tetratricopeptide repeat protein [Pseudomonadota bacterium]